MKSGSLPSAAARQQNFKNDENGVHGVDPGPRAATGNALVTCSPEAGLPIVRARNPEGRWKYWNSMACAGQLELKSNFTLEFGVRGGYWTNNQETQEFGGYFDPSLYNPSKGTFLDPGTYKQLNGWRYASAGQASLGGVPNRSPFVMPRLNAAWDVTKNGKNVTAGGRNVRHGTGNRSRYLRFPPSYVVSIVYSAG